MAVGCSDETTVFETQEDNLRKETDQLKIEGSVLFDNVGVLDIYEDPLTSAKRYGISEKAVTAMVIGIFTDYHDTF